MNVILHVTNIPHVPEYEDQVFVLRDILEICLVISETAIPRISYFHRATGQHHMPALSDIDHIASRLRERYNESKG